MKIESLEELQGKILPLLSAELPKIAQLSREEIVKEMTEGKSKEDLMISYLLLKFAEKALHPNE